VQQTSVDRAGPAVRGPVATPHTANGFETGDQHADSSIR
jgi:hypothetical protein